MLLSRGTNWPEVCDGEERQPEGACLCSRGAKCSTFIGAVEVLRIIRRAKEERFLLRVYRSALLPLHFSADLMEEKRREAKTKAPWLSFSSQR